MKKKRAKSKNYITTPCRIYVFSAILAIIFLLVSLFFAKCDCVTQCSTWWGNLFLNIGYGTIASIVVTFLVDVGNTKRQHKQDQKAFHRLNAELRDLCAELPSEMYIAVYEMFGYTNNKKRTFEDWTKMLFDDCTIGNSEHEGEIRGIAQHISEIKKAVAQLKSDIRTFGNSPLVDNEYEKKLNRLYSCSSMIVRNCAEHNYTVCCKQIVQQLKNAIVDLYDDLSVAYTRIYNEEDYE